jgi:ribose 5-phosphate isomerase A
MPGAINLVWASRPGGPPARAPQTQYGEIAMTVDAEAEKKAAAQAAAQLVADGMTVGLGTGSTVAYLLPALASRQLAIRCVSTSPRTEQAARVLGLHTEPFTGVDRFDIAIDGADEVTPDGWLVKGGGAAHTREKIVAAAADRFVVIVDSTKAVPALHGPVPLELLEFGLSATIRRLGPVTLRDVPRSPDGGIIADYVGEVGDPAALADFLSTTPGVVEHGLFPPQLVWAVVVGRGHSAELIAIAAPA